MARMALATHGVVVAPAISPFEENEVRSRMERLKQVSRDQDEAVRREQFLASYEDARQGVQERMRSLMAQLRTEMLRSPAAQKQKPTAVPPTWTEAGRAHGTFCWG
ncbi:DEK1 [Symbiodinium sp. CCMP2456]|nr:DEK1 [Symbiodinium sp. CCMP2456]